MSEVPGLRIRAANSRPANPDGEYVLYWMIAQRRTTWNFALQHAVAEAQARRQPLVVLEALRSGHRWASDRIHRFVLDGMQDNAKRLNRAGITYYPYVEPSAAAGRGLLETLAVPASLVITDEFPCFFLPRMVAAIAERLRVQLDVVDSNGILPLSMAPGEFPTAYAFRRFLQRTLPVHLEVFPAPDPLRGWRAPAAAVELPAEVLQRWPRVPDELLQGGARALAALPIDHAVGVAEQRGGALAGARRLEDFIDILPRYVEEHSEPEADVTSGLSPYLHFGHVSAHAVVHAVLEQEEWSPQHLSAQTAGKRQGWWGTTAPAEAFLDQVVTWRELGYVFCAARPADYDKFESLPEWARATLTKHARDKRVHLYDRAAFETANTHDPLWNAAQMQLRREGRIHNYLRMLWGKKIIEWSRSPQDALDIMLELNNRWALDGRNPNSYSGIFWVLGRFDRPWGPERPVFGTIRYMSSDNTARKFHVAEYVRRYTPSLL